MKKELERIVRYERVVYELEERIKKLEAVEKAARVYHLKNCYCGLCVAIRELDALHGGE